MLTKISAGFSCAIILGLFPAAQAQDLYNRMSGAAAAIDQQIAQVGQQIQELQLHAARLQQIRAQLVAAWDGSYNAIGVYSKGNWKCGEMDRYPTDVVKFIEPLYESALLKCQSQNGGTCDRAGFSCADTPGATYTVFVKPQQKAQ